MAEGGIFKYLLEPGTTRFSTNNHQLQLVNVIGRSAISSNPKLQCHYNGDTTTKAQIESFVAHHARDRVQRTFRAIAIESGQCKWTTTTKFSSMNMELKFQSAEHAILLEQSNLQTWNLAELKAAFLE